MKNYNKKKGFTIVELVIVVAVVGILTAVLVPTFVNLVSKANQSADEALVKNLNTQLRINEQTEGKNVNMSEAISDVKEAGYLLENLTPRGSSDIVWNQAEDSFELRDSAPESKAYEYWKIYNSASQVPTAQTYSIYAAGEAWTTVPALTVGFDAGENTGITSISYANTGAGQNVIFRTNGGKLSISGPDDEVKHFGTADSVDVVAVKMSSYEENGATSLIRVTKGNIALTGDATVDQIHLAKTGDGFDSIKITLEDDAELPELSRDSVGVSITDEMLVCVVAGSDSEDYYWLSGNGTIEDGQVLVSSSLDGEKTAATSEDGTAAAIANAKDGSEVVDTGVEVSTSEETISATFDSEAKLRHLVFNTNFIELKQTANITLTQVLDIPEEREVSIDFAGNVITYANNWLFLNHGNLTLNDSVGEGGISCEKGALDNRGGGTMTINGGTINASVRGGSTIRNGDNRFDAENTARLIINNVTVVSYNNYDVWNGAYCEINGGHFTGYSSSEFGGNYGYCISNAETDAEIVINGGVVNAIHGGIGINSGHGVINNVEVDLIEDNKNFYGLYVAGENGYASAEIFGGTFTTHKYEAVHIGNSNKNGDGGIGAPAYVYINGGTYTNTAGGAAMKVTYQNDFGLGHAFITSGTFSSEISAEYIVSPHVLVDNGNGTWTVQ